MGRVLAAAAVYGAATFDLLDPDREYNEYELMKLNAEWINTMMDEGRTILDIGPMRDRPNYPNCSSKFYCNELWWLNQRHYPRVIIIWPGG
jgi:hypothetical protein